MKLKYDERLSQSASKVARMLIEAVWIVKGDVHVIVRDDEPMMWRFEGMCRRDGGTMQLAPVELILGIDKNTPMFMARCGGVDISIRIPVPTLGRIGIIATMISLCLHGYRAADDMINVKEKSKDTAAIRWLGKKEQLN